MSLARYLPMPARRAGRGTLNYVQRIVLWRAILRDIKGVTAEDRRRLRRSAWAAPRTSWGAFYSWRNPVLLDDVDVNVPQLGRFRAHAHSDELYLLLPQREAAVYSAARAILRPGDTVVDAGANIGAFSVFAGRLIGPAGLLLAIEMMPRTATRLRANLERNALRARVIETALDRVSGRTLSAAIDPARGGQATLALAHTLQAPQAHSVTTRTLDDLLADVGEIALLKLDIEGAETAALAGASATLGRIHTVIFEQLDAQAATAAALEAHGFRIERLDAHNFLARRP